MAGAPYHAWRIAAIAQIGAYVAARKDSPSLKGLSLKAQKSHVMTRAPCEPIENLVLRRL